MTPELIAFLAIGVALLGMMFKLMSDLSNMRERMARIEGLFEGFTGTSPRPSTPP